MDRRIAFSTSKEKIKMSKFTYFEMIDAFKNAIRDAGGIPPDYIEADGQLHRFHIAGHKAGSKNGAYVLHSNGHPSGYFEDFTQGMKVTWKMDGNRAQFSEADKAQIAAANFQRKKELEDKHHKAADKARYIWRNSPFAITHPYLTRKQIQPHGMKINKYGALTIPLYNAQLELVNLQFIDADGNKRFLGGGQKKNCFCWLGSATETLLIAEGFATAASLHENKGLQTFVAFDAGNLEGVAKIIRAKLPETQIIIAGDNDESGVGQKAASAAARAVGGKFIIPKEVGMDWNDVLTQGGHDDQ
jgi:putative DNA primase/helicase